MRSRRRAPSSIAGTRGSSGAGGSRSRTTAHATSCPATNVVVAVGSGSRRIQIPGIDGIERLDERAGDADPRAAAEPARSWAVVRPAASSPRSTPGSGCPSTIVQSGPRLAPTDHPRNSEVIRATLEADGVDRADRCPRGRRAGPAPATDGRTRHRARRRLRLPRATSILARGRPRVAARRPRPGALRPRHERADTALSARWTAADRRWAVRRRRRCRPRAPHPPGPLPGRARRPDGLRARPSRPTTARSRAPRTPTPRRRSSGVSLEKAHEKRARRVRAGRRLREEHPRVRARGHVRPRHDRRRPRVTRARRRGHRLPRCVRGDPRMRAGDPGPRPDRRPGGHDPRLPVDVADLQRAVRRRARELERLERRPT